MPPSRLQENQKRHELQQEHQQDCNQSVSSSYLRQAQRSQKQQYSENVAFSSEVSQRKLCQEMKCLLEKEKRSSAEVECLAKELDELREKIQQTYLESNEYVRMMRLWANSHHDPF